MFSYIRKHAVIVSLSAALSGTMATEIILQNGQNDYNGCTDATISFSGPIPVPGNDTIWGWKETNFDSLTYLHANFCPT